MTRADAALLLLHLGRTAGMPHPEGQAMGAALGRCRRDLPAILHAAETILRHGWDADPDGWGIETRDDYPVCPAAFEDALIALGQAFDVEGE